MIDQRASVAQGASIGKNVSIGAFSIIEQEVEIGDDTWIGSHVVIRNGTTIGACNKIYQFSSIQCVQIDGQFIFQDENNLEFLKNLKS